MGLSAEQIALRKRGIGSSDIAAILGEDPFKSQLDVWLDKTGRIEPDESEFADLGNALEPVIADRFSKKNNLKLRRCGTKVHDEVPYAIASPDRRVVGVRHLVELKNVGWRMAMRWNVTRDVVEAPEYVLAQGHWQCMVYGMEGFWIAAIIGGRDWYQQHFEFDPDFASDLLEVAGEFWRNHVEKDVQPPPDASDRARKLLQRMHPDGGLGKLEPTPEIEQLAKDYARARALEGEWKRKKDQKRQHVEGAPRRPRRVGRRLGPRHVEALKGQNGVVKDRQGTRGRQGTDREAHKRSFPLTAGGGRR